MSKAILLVEDSVDDAKIIIKYLTKAGYYTIEHVTNYNSAIESLKRQVFDVVLIDINLNGIYDGIALAGTIDNEFYLPYLFTTGQNDNNILASIADLKYKNFIYKPIEEKNFIANLEIIIRTHTNLIAIGNNCLYDIRERQVFYNDKLVALTNNQTKLLEILALNLNKYVSRDDIIFYIWNDKPPRSTSSLRNLKKSLLESLEKKITIDKNFLYGYKLLF